MGRTAKRPRKVKLKYMGRIKDKGDRKRARWRRQFKSYPEFPSSKYMKKMHDRVEKSKKKVIFDKPLTMEVLEQHIKDLSIPKDDTEYVMMQWCKTNGFIIRTGSDLNLCSDSTCLSCSDLSKSLKDYAKNI